MPTYEFKCPDCGHSFEQLLQIKDRNLKTCPECRGKHLSRLVSGGSGIIFKGSGFYETDYKTKRKK
jgi:putative FmdB family regulatory protein